MMKEAFFPSFVSPGREVAWEGQTVNPEVQVTVVIGKVKSIDENGDNSKITVSSAPAKFDFHGLTNTSETIVKVLKEAQERDHTLVVRFEKKRRAKIDPTKTIAELAPTMDLGRQNVINTCVGVYNVNTEQWILSDEAQTSPNDDPTSILLGIQKAQVSTDGFFDAPVDEAPVQRVPRSQANDRANHLLSMFVFLKEKVAEQGFELDDTKVRFFSKNLLNLVDTLQMSLFGLNAPNYTDYSHTRARFLLFSYVDANPITEVTLTNKEAYTEWNKAFISYNRELWAWAIKDSQPTEGGEE